MNSKRIYFDMDGTIANFYGVEGWLDDLQNYNERPYKEAKPLYEIDELKNAFESLIEAGYELNIISWLSKDGTNKEFNNRVRKAKHEWLEAYGLKKYFTHIRITNYGVKKATSCKPYGFGVLVDDELRNRQEWNLGLTINANENILSHLRRLA